MKYVMGTALLALTLAACSGGSGTDADANKDGKVSAAEVEAENKKDGTQLKPQPGNYKVEMALVSAEGLPPELAEAVKGGMKQTIEQCVTKKEADKGFGPPTEELAGDAENGCKVAKYDLEGNNIEMKISCDKGPSGGTMEMAMTGTVTATKQDMTIVTKGMMGPKGSVTMSMKRERIGDCKS